MKILDKLKNVFSNKEPQNITEEMGIHEQWYEEAKEVTPEKLPDFIKKLTQNYEHDYGTIVHAITAAAIAGAYAVNHSEQGGITGFQAGCVMWEFIQNWKTQYKNKPLRLLNYQELLYPQYDYKFNSISVETWEWLQNKAQEELKNKPNAAPEVREHWQKIVEGWVPFGLMLKK